MWNFRMGIFSSKFGNLKEKAVEWSSSRSGEVYKVLINGLAKHGMAPRLIGVYQVGVGLLEDQKTNNLMSMFLRSITERLDPIVVDLAQLSMGMVPIEIGDPNDENRGKILVPMSEIEKAVQKFELSFPFVNLRPEKITIGGKVIPFKMVEEQLGIVKPKEGKRRIISVDVGYSAEITASSISSLKHNI